MSRGEVEESDNRLGCHGHDNSGAHLGYAWAILGI